MKQYDIDNPVKNLPDAYDKRNTSNNFKILEIERRTISVLRKDFDDISELTDIDNCYGKTLDLYGERIGQPRGKASDEQYRIMLKAKINRNISNGSFESVMSALCNTFNCEDKDIQIVEGDNAGKVERIVIPLPILNTAGFTAQQSYSVIKSLLPIGVELKTYLTEGTFEFSGVETEYDENAGFSESENGTIGGYFGDTESGEDVILPI